MATAKQYEKDKLPNGSMTIGNLASTRFLDEYLPTWLKDNWESALAGVGQAVAVRHAAVKDPAEAAEEAASEARRADWKKARSQEPPRPLPARLLKNDTQGDNSHDQPE
jgi:hypothetical protein